MDRDRPADAETRRNRLVTVVVVAVVHIVAIFGLIRAFSPGLVNQAVDTVLSTFTVTVTTPPPSPPPPPRPEPRAAGAQGAEGKKAVPREVKAPPPKVAIAQTPAPLASSTGSADTSGAGRQGGGTGAGGVGTGTGSGAGGSGTGGGAVSKPVHISGQIDNPRDFPLPPGGRAARIGKSVTIALTVAPNGRATACRVQSSSGLPDTDQVTCRLAIDRLRFKPAMNAAGEPVTGMFYWRQKFFF